MLDLQWLLWPLSLGELLGLALNHGLRFNKRRYYWPESRLKGG